jgi:EmrB/QacA subfamily drug resistance transporter
MSQTSTAQNGRAAQAGAVARDGRANGDGQPAGGSGAARRNLGIALVVIAAAQLMVVLDASIVNVALPHIQQALGFSGSGLEWVITAYAVTFGGLLLLGGRAGDLLGRRRVLIAGLVLFSAASLAGGFANSEAWLLTARALQGVGGAMIAPTALALITTTFPEGRPRNRAMAVYSAMSGAGLAIGLLGGGLLTNYLSWRWVMFVNAPIGILTALAAPRVLVESARRRGRFDLPGAITGTAGVAALVYGLSNASTDQSGVSHWGDTKVIVALAASVVLLVSFVLIERTSKHALMPLRILANRNRSGAYLMMLAVATAMFGVFFFLTIFVQEVLGYGALKTGVAFLPFAAGIVVVSAIASQLIPRVGARPLMVAGGIFTTGGMFWFSRLTEHSTYVNGLLGPILVTVLGLGLIFVPLFLTALAGVRNEDSGLASSLLNTGQQVGGAIGLAALGTVVWGGVANSARSQAAQAAAAAAKAGHPVPAPRPGAQLPPSILHHALAVGVSRGFVVGAGIALLALIVAVVMVRVRRADLAGPGAATTMEVGESTDNTATGDAVGDAASDRAVGNGAAGEPGAASYDRLVAVNGHRAAEIADEPPEASGD